MTADVDKSSLTDGQIIDLANAAFRDCEGGSLARMDNDLFYLRTVRAALAQAPAVRVTERMVRTACVAHDPMYDHCSSDTRADMHHRMRAALEAALAQQPAPSAPVGVEGLMQLARNWCLAWGEWAHDADPGCAKENAAEAELRAALTTALAQQPAAELYRCAACDDHYRIGTPCDCKVQPGHPDFTPLAQQPAACPRCDGTGEADSGGIMPWGAPAMIPCDCQQPAAVDGAMVERALVYRARHEDGASWPDAYSEIEQAYERETMHLILTAALAAQPGGSDNG